MARRREKTMKAIKMLDAGESPDFGAFGKDDILTEARVGAHAMQTLVDRKVAAWTDPPRPETADKKEDMTDGQ
jgi:hypothetical protein